MSLQLDKKWLGESAVDGEKILLEENQAIRIKSGESTVNLIQLNESGDAIVPQGVIATEALLSSELGAEALLREQGDATTLQSAKDYSDIETAARIAADDAMALEIDALETNKADISYVDSQDALINASIAQEILDRVAGDAATLQSAKDYSDAELDAQVLLINQAIDSLDQELADEVLARESADSALDARIEVLEANNPEIVEIDSLGTAPSLGLIGKVYVAKDSNKMYRWAVTGGGSLSFDLVVGAGEAYTTLESALAAAVDGQNILVKAGTYSVASTINVTKKVKIVGEDKATVIFQTAGGSSDPTSVFNVSVDDVALAKMTIKHRKTSNTSIESAVVASGGGFPQTRIKNFFLEQCQIEYLEFGLVVRVEGFTVRDCTFVYATGSAGNSNRCIGIYGNKGNSFIKSNHFKNDVLNGTAFRPIYLTSTTGTNANETVEGKLVIESNTHVGLLHQFYNQDNNQSAGANTFELQIKDNVITETSLFAGFFSASANAGNMFSAITLSGNSCSFTHGGTPVGGKGMFAVDGTAAFRSSALVLHESNNTFANTTYRTDYVSVEGTLVGRNSTTPSFTVAKDSVIPSSGTISSAITSPVSGGYVELSPTDEVEVQALIDASIDALNLENYALKSYADAGDLATLNSAKAYSDQKVADLVNSAPAVLDTLKELADALGGDANFATTVAGQIGAVDDKVDQEILDRIAGDASTLQSAKDYTDEQIALIPEVDLTNYYTKSEVDSKESALDSRLDVLEGKVIVEDEMYEVGVGGVGVNFVDLAYTAEKIYKVCVGRLNTFKNVDYSVSIAGGKTRLTWIGDLASAGVSPITNGDKLFITYIR